MPARLRDEPVPAVHGLHPTEGQGSEGLGGCVHLVEPWFAEAHSCA